MSIRLIDLLLTGSCARTVCPADLAPDNPQVAAANGLLCAVDVGNLLSEVEAVGGVSVWSCCRHNPESGTLRPQ